jgi:hypothetical protein
MCSKKLSNDARHAALILEARAGLIPESDWIAEEVRSRMERTASTGRFVSSHARLSSRGSDALAIKEILADLRHYCDSKGLGFQDLDAEACEDYQDEISLRSMLGCELS